MPTLDPTTHLGTLWTLTESSARARNALALTLIGAPSVGDKSGCASALLWMQEAHCLAAERYDEVALPHTGRHDRVIDATPRDFRAALAAMAVQAEHLRSYQCWAGSEIVAAKIRQLSEAALAATRGINVMPFTSAAQAVCPEAPGRDEVLTYQEFIRYPIDAAYARKKLHQQAFNVEICAAEVCAMLPLRFPELPPRAGLAMAIQCVEEIRHAEMLLDALQGEGGSIGETPVSLGIWNAARGAASAADCIGLEQVIGEGFSLGSDLFYAALYQRLGRADIGALHEAIHVDEVNHVRSGLRWFRALVGSGHARELEQLESRSGSKPMAGTFFGEEYRRFVGFSDAEIDRQRARAVPVDLPPWGATC